MEVKIMEQDNQITKPVFIYRIIDPRDNTVFYVGKTASIFQRFSQHQNNKTASIILTHKIDDIIESGNRLKFEIIEECDCDEDAKEREYYWIQKHLKDGSKLLNARIKPTEDRFDISFVNGVKERKFTWC